MLLTSSVKRDRLAFEMLAPELICQVQQQGIFSALVSLWNCGWYCETGKQQILYLYLGKKGTVTLVVCKVLDQILKAWIIKRHRDKWKKYNTVQHGFT